MLENPVRIARVVLITGVTVEVLGCSISALLAADVAASQPASRPATASASAPAGESLDPAVAVILDRLERKGDQIDSIEAQIEYIKIDPVLNDKQEYKGILRFKELKPNPKFYIEFDTFKQEGITRKSKQWHVFDGQWYIEARESTKTIEKTEIVRPGETVEVFKLGHGPFPLPFGQKKADIVKHFTVKLVKSEPKDPPNCDHLECTPRPGTEMASKYDAVHFFIDRSLDLPVRVRTTEKQEGNQIVASFSNIKVNPGLVASQLNLPELDYPINTNPLRDTKPDNEETGQEAPNKK